MITKFTCPTCNKSTETQYTRILFDKIKVEFFTCGHSKRIIIPKIERKNAKLFNTVEWCDEHQTICIKDIESLSGKHLMQFQGVGIEFILKSGMRALLTDKMGLGKTVQSIIPLKLSEKKEVFPCLVICKSISKYNWYREFQDWIPELIPQVIEFSKDIWFEQFPIHICSYDMIRQHIVLSKNEKDERNGKKEKVVREDIKKVLDSTKTIILDEFHHIGNNTSQRTIAIKKVSKEKPNFIGLSGTPVRNNAGEYFSPLNIVRPDLFSNFNEFIRNYCSSYNNGWGYKIGGLRNPKYFKNKTLSFILGRELDDVLPDLPPVRRNNNFVEVDANSEEMKIYNAEWKDFVVFYENNQGKKSFDVYGQILQRLNILRQMVGLLKVNPAVDFIEEFLTSTDRKITVFLHHHKTRDLLEEKLNESIEIMNKEMGMHVGKVLKLTAENTSRAGEIIEEFEKSDSRILLASTLAAGQSINLQFACADTILLERQWNPPNEEQAIVGRFRRIGQKLTVNITYLLAMSTIDDYFVDLVESKRQIINEIDKGIKSISNWNEQGIVMELAEVLTQKGREKFYL